MSKKKKKKSQKNDIQSTQITNNQESKVEDTKSVELKDVETKEVELKEAEHKDTELKDAEPIAEVTKVEEVKTEEHKSEEIKTVKTRFWTKKKLLIADLITVVLLIVADHVIKYIATVMLENRGSVVLVEDVLQLTYLKNTGGILGILQNQTLFIMFIVVVLIMIVIYLLTRLPDNPRFNIMHTVLSCLLAGALGNMLDRIRFGYVVDFIYFIGIDFPIFNCADILISISTIVMLLLLIFYYKEKDLEFLTFKQKRYRILK